MRDFLKRSAYRAGVVSLLRILLGNIIGTDKSWFIHPDRYAKDETGAWLLKIMPALSISDFPKVLELKKSDD